MSSSGTSTGVHPVNPQVRMALLEERRRDRSGLRRLKAADDVAHSFQHFGQQGAKGSVIVDKQGPERLHDFTSSPAPPSLTQVSI